VVRAGRTANHITTTTKPTKISIVKKARPVISSVTPAGLNRKVRKNLLVRKAQHLGEARRGIANLTVS